MNKFTLLSTLFLASIASSVSAAVVTTFGEDVNLAGGSSTAVPTNANSASLSFMSNLSNVGVETFESFPTETFVPIPLNFSGAASAVLFGSGTIVSGNDGGGRFPISGTQLLLGDVGGAFTVRFSSPVSAFGLFGTDIGDYGGQLVLVLTDIAGRMSTLTVPNKVGSNGSTSGSDLFFGFYDRSNSYTSIIVSDTSENDFFAFDNFMVGSPTPEPRSLALVGIAMVGARAWYLRRKSSGY